MTQKLRRIVYRHTAGPYPGLRQILAVCSDSGMVYLHTGEGRSFEQGIPDRLALVRMPPDGRWSKGMRLASNDKYVLYQEVCVEAAPEAAQEPAA